MGKLSISGLLLVSIILLSINGCRSDKAPDSIHDGILDLTGGGAKTVGVVDAAKRTLSMTTRIGEPKGLSGLIEEIQTPEYAVASGLILYSVSKLSHTQGRFSIPGLGSIIGRIPGKSIAIKLIDFVKSLLP